MHKCSKNDIFIMNFNYVCICPATLTSRYVDLRVSTISYTWAIHNIRVSTGVFCSVFIYETLFSVSPYKIYLPVSSIQYSTLYSVTTLLKSDAYGCRSRIWKNNSVLAYVSIERKNLLLIWIKDWLFAVFYDLSAFI